MFRILTIAILAGFGLWPSKATAEVIVTGDMLSIGRRSFENAPDGVAADELSFLNGEGLRFQFFLRVLPHTLGTGGTVFSIEFETEAGDIKSITFDGVGDAESTGNITSFADGTSNSLGSYPKDILTVYEVELGRDHWTISAGDEILLEQDYAFNDDRFTLRYRLGDPSAHPGDGTGIVAMEAEALYVEDWLTIADPGSPPIPNPPPSSDGSVVIVVSEGATVPRGVFYIRTAQLFAPKADALIGKSTQKKRGGDLYNLTGHGQTLLIRKRSHRKAVFRVQAQNDAFHEDRLRISGRGRIPGSKVAYEMQENGSTRNVTANVKAGRLITGQLESGDSKHFRVTVEPRNRRLAQRSRRESKGAILVRVETVEEPVAVDVVKAVIRAPKRKKADLPAWFSDR